MFRSTFAIALILAAVFFSASFTGCSIATVEYGIDPEGSAALPEASIPEFAAAFKTIENSPDSAKGHVMLASAYIKHARATSDFSLNHKAEAAIDDALRIEPQNLNARKLKASLLATFHRFTEARAAALDLENEIPNDPFIYGVLTDANDELGNYTDAIASAQKMVDLKPNASSYARVGHIRSLHGDHKGAVEMLDLAIKTADPMDKEAQAWGFVQLGKEYFKSGELDRAERSFDRSLAIIPNYAMAIVEKARVRASKGDLARAEQLLTDLNRQIPQTQAYILLGDIYDLKGRPADAQKQYESAEALAHETDGDMHRFALLWADHDTRLDEALKIATADFQVNKDIYASDILAWCLFKKGRFDEAKQMITEALRLESRDARLFYHAGMIEQSLGNRASARRHLQTALNINPAFDLAQSEVAKLVLRKL